MSELLAYACDGPHCGERAITQYRGGPDDWLVLHVPPPDADSISSSMNLHFHSLACLADWVTMTQTAEAPADKNENDEKA